MMSYKHGGAAYIGLNRLVFRYLLFLIFTVISICLGAVQAEEKRHHGAHVHGVANLNIAVEGNNIYIEFSSPSANIVGFGHHPRTQAQKDAVAGAVNTLQQGDALFLLSATSGCKLLKSSVDTDIDKDADHHSEEGHHGHEEKHSEDHGHADEHERHSDFTAQYHFTCQKSDKLSLIEVMLFRAFPGIEHIDVQLLTETKQTAVELTAKQNKISL